LRQFQTNTFGLIALTKAFIPHFRNQRSGVIINIGSISADQGYPYTSAYEASKAAVVSLSEGLNAELAEFGITVKAILPGSMDTRIFDKMDLSENTPAAYENSIKAFYSLDLFQARSHPALPPTSSTRPSPTATPPRPATTPAPTAPPSPASSNSSARTGTGRNSAPSSPATPARYGRHSSPPPPPTSKRTCPRRSAGPGY
jgi:NAD(P)-dependent dehydrogenase (short-subunit alcohol dehydrogenase family)